MGASATGPSVVVDSSAKERKKIYTLSVNANRLFLIS